MRPDYPDFLLLKVRQRKRVSTALLLSLLIHALLLSLSLSGQGVGLPGLDLPWRERRFGADDLRVTLIPAPLRPAHAIPALPGLSELPPTAAPDGAAATESLAVESTQEAPSSTSFLVPTQAPTLLAVERTEAKTWTVPAAPLATAPVLIAAAAASAASPESLLPVPRDLADAAQKQIALVERERAQEQAKERLAQEQKAAAARLEAMRLQDAAAQAAARQELERVEAARALEAERQEAARQAAAARQEAVRQAAARQEAERLDRAARVDAERPNAERQEAARQEASRQEAARQETAKQDAAKQARAALDAARAEQDAKREEARRAMGRQLDEEAARRDFAARQSAPSLLPGSSSLRRGRLFGRSDPNAELLLYAEAWARKIQLNQTMDMIREVAKQPHTQPLVTVAVRSDGSIESVSFVRSSGVPEIDAAIRRIVQSQAPYPPFQAALTREFDVIEIRRSWNFDSAIRLD